MQASMAQLGSSIQGENPFKCDEAQYKAWKAENARRQWAERLKRANIPLRFRNAKMSDCSEEVRGWLSAAIEGNQGWLVLSGDNGTGKTHQACACAIQAARYMDSEFTTMDEIRSAIQSTFNGSGSADKVMRHYQKRPFLVIDEIEKFKATEWSAPLLFTLINGRYNENKPTIITTNLSGDKMFAAFAAGAGEELAASLMSRLADKSNTHVTFKGADRRLL